MKAKWAKPIGNSRPTSTVKRNIRKKKRNMIQKIIKKRKEKLQ